MSQWRWSFQWTQNINIKQCYYVSSSKQQLFCYLTLLNASTIRMAYFPFIFGFDDWTKHVAVALVSSASMCIACGHWRRCRLLHSLEQRQLLWLETNIDTSHAESGKHEMNKVLVEQTKMKHDCHLVYERSTGLISHDIFCLVFSPKFPNEKKYPEIRTLSRNFSLFHNSFFLNVMKFWFLDFVMRFNLKVNSDLF